MVTTMERMTPADGIFLTIRKTSEGQEVITNDFTPFDGLSNEEIIDLIETDNRLYMMEVLRRRKKRKYQERNRVKIAIIRMIKAL